MFNQTILTKLNPVKTHSNFGKIF